MRKVKLGDFSYFNADNDQVGKQTPIAVRFSTVGGESGSADTARCQERSQMKLPNTQITKRCYIETKRYLIVQCFTVTTAISSRDPRGFAVKFYTEEGNWDIVGNNTPIFFIRCEWFQTNSHLLFVVLSFLCHTR